MKWIDAIVYRVRSTFGGTVTFCEDLDGLLDIPAVREALRAAEMRLVEWEGDRSFLRGLLSVSENDRPLVVVRREGLRHVAEAELPGRPWEVVSLGLLFPRFHIETVRQIPEACWDQLLALHAEARSILNATDTATLIGRALFGVDPLHLQFADGWAHLLAGIAASGEGLPRPVAEITARKPPAWLSKEAAFELLQDPRAARTAIRQLLQENPEIEAKAGDATRVLLHHAPRVIRKGSAREWRAFVADNPLPPSASGREVLKWAVDYAKGLAEGAGSDELCLEANRAFYAWVRAGYELMLHAQDPQVLKIHTLSRKLHEETADDRLLLIVVDGLSVSAWMVWEAAWRAAGLIGDCRLRSGFTCLPTVTSLCRRALFEGALPNHFGPGDHSQALERRLWRNRFGEDGAYYAAQEAQGIRDAISLGRSRIAVVDYSWDRKGHALDPRYESPEEAARLWAERTGLRDTVREAHASGYKVFVTSDHGHIKCEGIGNPNVGVLTDERSQRVLIFGSKSIRDGFATKPGLSERVWDYAPPGLPSNCCPLFAADQYGFGYSGSLAVSHGGISLEEAIIPVAEVFAP